jgi:ABC-type branched-subunit amino acid transport system substrate-binding protein
MRRRELLQAAGLTGVAGLTAFAGCSGDGGGTATEGEGDDHDDEEDHDDGEDFPSLGNYPVEGDEVTFGFNVPQSGPYSNEGADELRAYNLAADHLNNGGGWVDMWSDLSGDGVLGKTVTSVEGDTATDPDTARQALSRMISRDNVIMASGGSSSAVAIAQQGLAQEEKVLFMCCLTHSNDTTGPECVRYGFREMFNAFMTGQALAPVVADEYGEDLNFYQLYADYSWGQTQQDSMGQFLESEANWNELDSVATPLSTSDYSTYLADVPDDADALILNHYGLDGAASLSQAIDAGMDQDLEIIVPLYNREMAKAAADSIDGIFGTADWSWQLDDDVSQAFVSAFQDEYDKVPSYAARLAYTVTMSYAAACERAGTFYPPEVIRQLEGWEYDQAGLGAETMRACDHQAQRDVLVVRGLPSGEQTEDRLLEVVDTTSRDDLGYACDTGLAAECELGEYGDE